MATPNLPTTQKDTTIRSNVNQLPRQDVLVTTIKADSKQDVTPGNIGAMICDGGLVVKKGLKLGRSEYVVPGVLNYIEGHFLGFKEDCKIVEFECKPRIEEFDILMESTVTDETLTIRAKRRLNSHGIFDIWGRVESAFAPRGRIYLPFEIKSEAPLQGTIAYDRDTNAVSVDNYVKPLLYDAATDSFNFFLESGTADVRIYHWHIEAVVKDESEHCADPPVFTCQEPDDIIEVDFCF